MTVTLLERQIGFVTALREAGLPVSVAESLDAAASMIAVDLLAREQLRAALAATLVKRQVHRATFDSVFDVFYPTVTGPTAAPASTTEVTRDPVAAPRGPLDDPRRDQLRADLADYLVSGDEAHLDALAREAVGAFGSTSGQGGAPSWSRLSTLHRISARTLMARVLEQLLAGADRGGLAERRARTAIEARIARFEQRVGADVARRLAEQSDAASAARTARRPGLEQIAFLGATRADLAALRRQIAPLARRLAARLTVDQRRGHRGQLDFRRTVRASLSSGGVPMQTRHRPKLPTRSDLVVLCDLSDSVSSFAHFTLLLVYALREQFTRVRAFGFVDELDELTRFFAPGRDVVQSIAALVDAADVTTPLGRTDYGRALALFEHRFGEAVGPKTSLLILGDARSNYGALSLDVLSGLVGRAKHAYWLNPERGGIWDTGDSRAADFAAIVPMVECRNLAQLGNFVRDLARVRT